MAYIPNVTIQDTSGEAVGVTDKALDVTVRETDSPLFIVNFSKIVTETTLTTAAAKDDTTILVADTSLFLNGQYLTIYSVADNRVYFSTVLNVASLTVTLDTPIDFEFPIGSIVSVADTDMAVDGSVTPQIFGLRNPTTEDIPLSVDISRIMFAMLTASEPELSDFGDITNGLTNGMVLRKVDDAWNNIFNVKSNMAMKHLMYDLEIQTVAKNKQDGITGRFTFEKLGQVIRLREDEDLQIIIQDDLSSLQSFYATAEGIEALAY